MDNQIQNKDFILPGGLGSVTIASTGETHEIKSVENNDVDGSVTLTVDGRESIKPSSIFQPIDWGHGKPDKDGKCETMGILKYMELFGVKKDQTTEDAEFEIID